MVSKLYFSLRRAALGYLRGPNPNNVAPASDDIQRATEQSYWQFQAFYLIYLMVSFELVRKIYRTLQRSIEREAVPEPLWAVIWVNWVSLETAVFVIGLALPVSALAALWRPAAWWPRMFVFVCLLQYTAFDNSFGSINHFMYYPLWISFIFLFAPVEPPKRGATSISVHMRYLYPAFLAQVFIGLFYTLSGYHKVINGFFPSTSTVSSFHPDALPLLAFELLENNGRTSMLGNFFSNHLWIGWPAFLSVMYFELFFIIAVFRPQLHRLFGFVFAAFHIGVWLVMGITFQFQPIMVALIFIMSPFALIGAPSLRDTVYQLPGVDFVVWIRRALKPRHTVP